MLMLRSVSRKHNFRFVSESWWPYLLPPPPRVSFSRALSDGGGNPFQTAEVYPIEHGAVQSSAIFFTLSGTTAGQRDHCRVPLLSMPSAKRLCVCLQYVPT